MNPYHVRLRCDDPALDLVVLLGDDTIKVTAGGGKWEITERPQQVSMTTFAGVEPVQLTLPLLFDGWRGRTSQERKLRKLFTVWRGDEESPPGVLTVTGIPLPVRRWVIEAIDYGDPLLSTDGNRIRQPLSLTLREYVPPTYLQLRRRALQGTKGKTKVITSRKGDTPTTIAKRQKCKASDILQLNATIMSKANQKLKTGTKLRVPVAKVKK